MEIQPGSSFMPRRPQLHTGTPCAILGSRCLGVTGIRDSKMTLSAKPIGPRRRTGIRPGEGTRKGLADRCDRMTTIDEFLEARLGEDEHSATHSGSLPVPKSTYHQRTLSEVAAKRSIVRRYRDAPITEVAPLLDDMRDLASVYADHPDYNQASRPLSDPTEIDLRPGTHASITEDGQSLSLRATPP